MRRSPGISAFYHDSGAALIGCRAELPAEQAELFGIDS